MRLDPDTLLVAAAAVAATVGLLFVATPRRAGRSAGVLRAWGAAMLLGAAGLAIQAPPWGPPPRGLSQAMLVGATALAWATARAFDGARAPWPLVAAGPALCLLAAVPGAPGSFLGLAATGTGAAYLGAAAGALWAGRRAEPLPSRALAAGLLALHALAFAARAAAGLLAHLGGGPDVDWRAPLLLEATLFQVASGLALLSLARERAERRARRALAAGRKAAVAASAAKSRFAADLSHELRTPLNGLLGLVDRLAGDARLPPDARAAVEAMAAAGRHMRAVVGDTLDLARVEAGRLELAPGPVALAPLLRECVALTEPAATAAPAVAFPVEVDPALPAVVEADGTRLRQVLLNLLGNAARHAPAGSAVRLRAGPGGRPATLRIVVEDAGPGVPAARRHELFAAFRQLEAPGDGRPRGGAGLGLAVSAALVAAMGGRIGYEPGPGGRGSLFWFETPLRAAAVPAEEPARPIAAAPPPPPRPLELLVVDDVAVNREVARALVGTLGHRADTAADGPAALAALGRRAYDAVLLDLGLPGGMDGLEVARRIRALGGPYRRMPVVALTARAEPADAAASRAAGMDAHLAKPLDREALRRVLDAVAARRGIGDDGRADAA